MPEMGRARIKGKGIRGKDLSPTTSITDTATTLLPLALLGGVAYAAYRFFKVGK